MDYVVIGHALTYTTALLTILEQMWQDRISSVAEALTMEDERDEREGACS